MKNNVLIRSAAALLLSLHLSLPAAPTVEERLQALEQQVQQLSRENSELKQQLANHSPGAAVSVSPGGKEAKMSVGGFLQGQAEFGRAPDSRWSGVRDRFYFRRARIYVAGSFAEDFEYKAELDLQGNTLSAGTGQLARGNEIYLSWRKFSYANVRFGQLKPAFGAEALASDTKILTIERSLPSDRLTDGRQMAISVGGDLPGKQLSYLMVVADGNGTNVSANDNSKFQKSARLAYTPVASAADRVTLGVDGLWTEDSGVAKSDFGFTGNLFSGRRQMWGLDAQWTHGRWDLSGEYLHGTFRPQNAVPRAHLDAAGWQATAAVFLVPGRLQAVLRHEEFDPNTALGGNTFRTNLLGLSYLIKGDDLKLSVNYLDGHAPAPAASEGRLITRVQVIF